MLATPVGGQWSIWLMVVSQIGHSWILKKNSVKLFGLLKIVQLFNLISKKHLGYLLVPNRWQSQIV